MSDTPESRDYEDRHYDARPPEQPPLVAPDTAPQDPPLPALGWLHVFKLNGGETKHWYEHSDGIDSSNWDCYELCSRDAALRLVAELRAERDAAEEEARYLVQPEWKARAETAERRLAELERAQGWQWVPVEPTPEMRAVMVTYAKKTLLECDHRFADSVADAACRYYELLLSAAPPAPGKGTT